MIQLLSSAFDEPNKDIWKIPSNIMACKKNGLKVKKENISSLSRLDQDRAEAIYRQT